MTITFDAPTLNAPSLNLMVDVRFTPTGTPLAVRYDGGIWTVDPELDTMHWFTRDSWWDTRTTAPRGVGNVVDIEHWRIQVRLSSNSALRTFLLRRDPTSTQWLLDGIDDAS
ncbi:hypothetical protein [Arthrobacter sp. ISL-65]|uniref:hypothetical protein n=1 Tax=Arthrobacter sp. ISL-65 TaxID=2819112 RepID=UPI001BEB9E06|nr:hypothetical protein [Arthrobacter sp. ISL-65]MBT2551262.1 hypothetical protein [Arthrobacter sp. ISL-65]